MYSFLDRVQAAPRKIRLHWRTWALRLSEIPESSGMAMLALRLTSPHQTIPNPFNFLQRTGRIPDFHSFHRRTRVFHRRFYAHDQARRNTGTV